LQQVRCNAAASVKYAGMLMHAAMLMQRCIDGEICCNATYADTLMYKATYVKRVNAHCIFAVSLCFLVCTEFGLRISHSARDRAVSA
jgi:hypothetical protein